MNINKIDLSKDQNLEKLLSNLILSSGVSKTRGI